MKIFLYLQQDQAYIFSDYDIFIEASAMIIGAKGWMYTLGKGTQSNAPIKFFKTFNQLWEHFKYDLQTQK